MKITSLFGITIGPIYEVLRSSKKIRELWGGSLLFSLIMQHLWEDLSGREAKDVEIFQPFFKQDDSIKAGLFPDMIIGGSSLIPDELSLVLQNTVTKTFGMVADLAISVKSTYTKDELVAVLKQSLFIDFVISPAEDTKPEGYVAAVTKQLNAIDQSRSFVTGRLHNTCERCLQLPAKDFYEDDITRKVKVCPLCLIKLSCLRIKDMTKKLPSKYKRGFQSIIEVALADILKDEEYQKVKEELEKDELDMNMDKFSSLIKPKELKKYHSYAAIVKADGDNLGKIAKEFGTDITGLSKALFEFGKGAATTISEYGGIPVYIGGDDVLALTPLAVQDDRNEIKTVLQLAKNLSDQYCDQVKMGDVTSTLSVGIMVFYYKSPLSLAMREASHALDEAKKSRLKNGFHLTFIQHSGTTTTFALSFEKADTAINVLQGVVSGTMKLPESISYNLKRFEHLLCLIPDRNRLQAFFENNFNENVHTSIKLPETLMGIFESFGFPDGGSDEKPGILKDILSFLKICKLLRSV